MYHSETDTPAVARNSNLNEELGQVCCQILCGAYYFLIVLRCSTYSRIRPAL